MSRFAILASVFALAVGTTGCGNSQVIKFTSRRGTIGGYERING